MIESNEAGTASTVPSLNCNRSSVITASWGKFAPHFRPIDLALKNGQPRVRPTDLLGVSVLEWLDAGTVRLQIDAKPLAPNVWLASMSGIRHNSQPSPLGGTKQTLDDTPHGEAFNDLTKSTRFSNSVVFYGDRSEQQDHLERENQNGKCVSGGIEICHSSLPTPCSNLWSRHWRTSGRR